MPCEVADRLTANLRNATVRYSEVIMRMAHIPSDPPSRELYDVRRAADRARAEAERARLELEQHRQQHGC